MYLIPKDFEGYYDISTDSFSSTELTTYIDSLEPTILRRLLGVELYNLFLADLDTNNVPQTPIYQAIYNAFDIDYNCTIISSTGMLDVLKGFIYYDYMRDSQFASVITGKVKNEFANSEKASFIEFGLQERYNIAVQNASNIQWFICQNETDYPTYNGQEFKLQLWL